jgi:hypothetical protein
MVELVGIRNDRGIIGSEGCLISAKRSLRNQLPPYVVGSRKLTRDKHFVAMSDRRKQDGRNQPPYIDCH